MYIERLQVESEGFLGGLDVRFSAGLNVIIGARGTGKTSIIELIRYCLDAGAFTEDVRTRGNQQAIAILGGGAVTVSLRDGDTHFDITRSAAGHYSRNEFFSVPCTVLAQSEVEAVGAQASGRLHLIDRFRSDRDADKRKLESVQSRLKSLTVEVSALLGEGRTIIEEIEALGTVDDQLTVARSEQARVLAESEATETQQRDLEALQDAGRIVAARDAVVLASEQRASSFVRELERTRNNSKSLLQQWPPEAGEDLFADSRRRVEEVTAALNNAVAAASELVRDINRAKASTHELRVSVDEQSRNLRQILSSVQAGVGQATRRVAELEERRGKAKALDSLLSERRVQYNELIGERDALYRSLDKQRTDIFEQRRAVAENLTTSLSPIIRVRVSRSEDVGAYRSAIISALRGSGIHYNNLAPQIAREVSPYELTRWVEESDNEALASALGIRPDRAATIIASLSGSSTLASILSAPIEDGVALELLDGLDYKPSDQLSIGQRCTVVLPVLLGNHGDTLIIDQPEDHLDNAFIASTLVSALRNRRTDDQMIFSSHNANIPVLGDADRVVVMQSDGEHGFVKHQGALEESYTVDHITQVMEGGIEAFEARSLFYEQRTEGT
jgi:hypothetical protein